MSRGGSVRSWLHLRLCALQLASPLVVNSSTYASLGRFGPACRVWFSCLEILQACPRARVRLRERLFVNIHPSRRLRGNHTSSHTSFVFVRSPSKLSFAELTYLRGSARAAPQTGDSSQLRPRPTSISPATPEADAPNSLAKSRERKSRARSA